MRNWTNESDYSFTQSLNQQGWAWEFLRRNKGYQADWQAALKDYPITDLLPDDPRFAIRDRVRSRKWQRDNLINPNTDEPLFSPFSQAIAHRTHPETYIQKNGKTHPFATLITEVFNLSRPLAAQLRSSLKHLTNEQQWLRLNGLDIAYRERTAPAPAIQTVSLSRVAVTFDLTRSLPKQMEKAKRLLKELSSPGAGKPHKTNLCLYLRILDAEECGATPKEMRTQLIAPIAPCSEERLQDARLYEARKAARHMCETGYKNLLIHD